MDAPAPAPQIRMVALSELRPYERNARTHSPEQVAAVAASIASFGFTAPILVTPDGMIVAGHGRYAAAESLGLAEVPVVEVGADWTPEQIRAYVLADNQLALSADWDGRLLALELEALGREQFDLSLVGFSEVQLQNLIPEFYGASLAPEGAAANWNGMPSFEQGDKTAFRSLTIHFKDQAAVDLFAELTGQKITEKTRFLWFPEIEIETYVDKAYVAKEEPEDEAPKRTRRGRKAKAA